MGKEVFEKIESNVRSYCRTWPEVFNYAKGSIIKDINGKEYIDFFNGAGALDYGHNPDYIKEKLIEYLKSDRIVHSLDMYTTAKEEFLTKFNKEVLEPRNLDYKVMFCGPTGTNAVEASIKLARKVKNRSNIFALMGAFHGMTLGALALTTDAGCRNGAGVGLNNVIHIPAPYMNGGFDTLEYLRAILNDDHSGIERPAAIIIECVQAEGGVYVFSNEFIKGIRKICDEFDMLMIVDDIQVGVNRTGSFFSYERANIIPDIVTLSKSISGYGMPLGLSLFKKDLDVWSAGEHNGTFRGNQLSLVAASAGLDLIKDLNVSEEVKRKEKIVQEFMDKEITPIINGEVRGIGLVWGIDLKKDEYSKKIVKDCFEDGLILERAGRDNSVVKIMPSLVIEDDLLLKGLNIIKKEILKEDNILKKELK